MSEEAERFKDEDKKKRELVEACNHADQLTAQIEKDLKENGDKVGAEDKTAIETALTAVKDAMKGDDAEKIKSSTQALMQASMKLGEAIYASGKQNAEGGDAGPDAGASGGQGEDNVVDAQFEEVKDDKKKSA